MALEKQILELQSFVFSMQEKLQTILFFLGTKHLDLRLRQARIPRNRGGSCSQCQLQL